MKHIIFLILLFPVLAVAQPRGYWKQYTPNYPQGHSVYATIIADSAFSVFIDTSGFISTSSDGGNSWSAFSETPIPKNVIPKSVSHSFFYFQINDSIFTSDDTLKTLKKIFILPDTLYGYSGFTMLTPSSGFLLYTDTNKHYHDLITHDGGKTFLDQGHDSLFQAAAQNYKEIKHSNNFVMKWLDSLNGILWIRSTSITHTYNRILVTHNGAKDWQISSVLSPSGDTTINLSQNGHAYGGTYVIKDIRLKPYFYYSTDYGAHWNTTDTATITTNPDGFSIPAPTTIWATARQTKDADPSSSPVNTMLYTNDLGKHWYEDHTTFNGYNTLNVTFLDSLHGIAAARKNIDNSFYAFKFIFGSSGIAQNRQDAGIEIYPNPCANELHLSAAKEFLKLRIYNLLGREVYISQSEEKVIDVSRLPEGIYFVHCIFPDGSITRRSFIKTAP